MKTGFFFIIGCITALSAFALFKLSQEKPGPDPDPVHHSAPAPEAVKSMTTLLGNHFSGMYRTLDLETGIVCYYPTGSGVGINCLQFEEGPAETPTANQLARM